MYLHFAHDNIFLDNFIKLVSKVHDISRHRFILYSYADGNPLAKDERIERADVETIPDILRASSETKGIFLHCFSSRILSALNGLRDNIPVFWLYWGNELTYPNEYYTGMLFGKETKKLFFNSGSSRFRHFHHSVAPAAAGIYKHFDKGYRVTRKAMRNINYFCHYNIFDFNDYRKEYFRNAEFKPFFYPFDENYFDKLPQTDRGHNSGNKVLIGNSGNYANNHAEAFGILRDSGLTEFKIVCPLSYGDSVYIKNISEEGRRIFGNNFESVNEFLAAKDYHELISGCEAVIMNHRRSEAAGAIITALFLGKKVYMNPVNNLYRFLRSLGISVYNVNDRGKGDSMLSGLSEEKINNNREIIYNNFSFSKSAEYLKNILLN